MPWQCRLRGRVAVTAGSSWRRAPAAALRGLTYVRSPRSRCTSFILSNPARGMKTSLRTSSSAGGSSPRSLRGTARMVRTLAVTSSPRAPSPRVAPLTRHPFSYTRLIASPSIFTSPVYSTAGSASCCAPSCRALPSSAPLCCVPPPCCPPSRSRIRRSNARTSPSSKALASESIGTRWTTSGNDADGAAPTRCVGESGVTRPGRCSSSATSSRMRASYSWSAISGSSRT